MSSGTHFRADTEFFSAPKLERFPSPERSLAAAQEIEASVSSHVAWCWVHFSGPYHRLTSHRAGELALRGQAWGCGRNASAPGGGWGSHLHTSTSMLGSLSPERTAHENRYKETMATSPRHMKNQPCLHPQGTPANQAALGPVAGRNAHALSQQTGNSSTRSSASLEGRQSHQPPALNVMPQWACC